jgi:hypothetical protein
VDGKLKTDDGGSLNLEFDFDAGRNPGRRILCRQSGTAARADTKTELFGYAVSRRPLKLFDDVALGTYCPVGRVDKHVGETVMTCGLVVEQRTHHQITGEPIKLLKKVLTHPHTQRSVLGGRATKLRKHKNAYIPIITG